VSVLSGSVLREVLYHDVGEHVRCQKVSGFDGVPFTDIMDKVDMDTDVLGALMEPWILCKLDCTLVIDKDLLGPGTTLESLSEHKQWEHCLACLYRILPYNMRVYKERT